MVETLKRVFAGASIPPEVRMAVSERVQTLEIPGTLVPVENWHITLRFLGQVSEVTYERFLGGLSEESLPKPFKIGLEGLGGFPRAAKATVFWVGVGSGARKLEDLSGSVETAAQNAGLEPENRPFAPHVTLSRIRPPQDVSELLDAGVFDDIQWRCDSLVVYESHLGGGPPRYEPLEIFRFER